MLSKKAFGIPGAIAVLYAGFTAMLDVRDRREEPGMLGDIAGFLANPPPGFVLFALGMGLWLLWVYQYHGIIEVRDRFEQRRVGANQRFADDLQTLRSEAVALLAPKRPPRNVKGMVKWEGQEEEWRERVFALMRDHGCSPQDMKRVEELSPLEHTSGQYNTFDNQKFVWLAERLRRIDEIIQKYVDYPMISNESERETSVQTPWWRPARNLNPEARKPSGRHK